MHRAAVQIGVCPCCLAHTCFMLMNTSGKERNITPAMATRTSVAYILCFGMLVMMICVVAKQGVMP